MKIFSEITNKYYQSVDDCLEDEKNFQNAKREKEEKAKREREDFEKRRKERWKELTEESRKIDELRRQYAQHLQEYEREFEPQKRLCFFDNPFFF